jgi:hypothetical protein
MRFQVSISILATLVLSTFGKDVRGAQSRAKDEWERELDHEDARELQESVTTSASPSVAATSEPTVSPSFVPSDMPSNAPSSAPSFNANRTFDFFVNSHYIATESDVGGVVAIENLPYWFGREKNTFERDDVICMHDVDSPDIKSFQCAILVKEDVSGGAAWRVKISSGRFQEASPNSGVLINEKASGKVTEANQKRVNIVADGVMYPGDEICLVEPYWRYKGNCSRQCIPICYTVRVADMGGMGGKEVSARMNNFYE